MRKPPEKDNAQRELGADAALLIGKLKRGGVR